MDHVQYGDRKSESSIISTVVGFSKWRNVVT